LSENLPAYYWIATYKDRSTLPQYDPDGKEHLFSEVDQSQLYSFGWYPLKDKKLPSAVIALKPNQTLIVKRRVMTPILSGKSRSILFLLGWKEKGTKGKQKIIYLRENGEQILSDSFDLVWSERHGWVDASKSQ